LLRIVNNVNIKKELGNMLLIYGEHKSIQCPVAKSHPRTTVRGFSILV
jgi:hypothetical protein